MAALHPEHGGDLALVKHIQSSTRIPVLGHAEGVCTLYLDAKAAPDMATRLAVDGKCNYPSACNATETLCVLYVAMTRARYALHMLVPPSNKKEDQLPATTAGLLRATLTDGDEVDAGVVLFEEGDPEWWSRAEQPDEPVAEDITLDIALEPCGGSRRRGRTRRAPSGLEGPSEVDVAAIFEAGSGANMQHGTLVHALSLIHI